MRGYFLGFRRAPNAAIVIEKSNYTVHLTKDIRYFEIMPDVPPIPVKDKQLSKIYVERKSLLRNYVENDE